jgi:molybdopterin molybdotransferase
MLSVTQAVQRILDVVEPFPPEPLPITDARGLSLAEPIVSGIDSPPFDKALVDGFAVRAADVATGQATLTVLAEVSAGQVPTREVEPGTAIQIMTGAPLPGGADAVVRIEDTHRDGGRVVIAGKAVAAGQNILRRGTALTAGEKVLAAGDVLTPSRIGALAELGCGQVLVRRRPRVAILATGDELVPVEATPGPGQIRNSNEAMLSAQIAAHGALPTGLGIARDHPQELAEKIRTGLEFDVLVLSGGVSAGKFDLVPTTLAALQVEQVFHKVDLKPGKPVWFGLLARRPEVPQDSAVVDTPRAVGSRTAVGSQSGCYVFGLPGNPVSSLVCCELFVRTALRRLMGLEPAEPIGTPARLTRGFHQKSDRPTYHPAFLSWSAEGLEARLVTWHGSSDLRATVDGNGMVLLPTGEREYQAGETVDAFWWG